MPEYFCGKCGKTFYQKSHSDAHQKRKTPCHKPKPKPSTTPVSNDASTRGAFVPHHLDADEGPRDSVGRENL